MNWAKELAGKGRHGDTMLAHINPQEASLLKALGGSGTINPETGLPEYFSFKKSKQQLFSPVKAGITAVTNPSQLLKKDYWQGIAKDATDFNAGGILSKNVEAIGKQVAPIALSMIPVVGPAVGAAYSAANRFGQEGSFGKAVATGAGSYLGSTYGGQLGGALGASGAAANALGSGIIGAGTGLATGGGTAGAIKGGASGAIGGYMRGGGANEIAGKFGYGTEAGAKAGSDFPWLTGGNTGAGGATTSGGGIMGSASSWLPALAAGGSALNSMRTNKKSLADLTAAESQAMGYLNPYMQTGQQANTALAGKLASGELGGTFNPGDLTQDPGYKFNLEQGQQALDRKNVASGKFFSGEALQAAQDYGQGLADNTYNAAYNRWLQGQENTYSQLAGQSGQGLQSAGVGAGLTTDIGSAKANARQATSNSINQSLASLLYGNGRKWQ